MYVDKHSHRFVFLYLNYQPTKQYRRKVCCLGEILCIVSIFNEPNEAQNKELLLSKLLVAAFSPSSPSAAWLLFKAYLFQIGGRDAASIYACRLEKHHTNAIAIANGIGQNSKCKISPKAINLLAKSALSIFALCKFVATAVLSYVARFCPEPNYMNKLIAIKIANTVASLGPDNDISAKDIV